MSDADALVRLLGGTATFRALTPEQRQHLPRLLQITELAWHVWEDDDAAREFLVSAQPRLGGRSPLDLAVNGADLSPVEQLLNQLEYSLPV